MLVNRHHARYLIDLGQVAQGKSAEQLAPLKDHLDAFLNTLGGAATPAARRAFDEQMQRLPKDDRPWSAIRRPDPTTRIAPDARSTGSGPPAVVLLLAQVDDDPDSDEDGNRIPDLDAPDAAPWADLHQALLRWDTAEIQRWIGPLGWQRPTSPLELTQEPELAEHSPRRSREPRPRPPLEPRTRPTIGAEGPCAPSASPPLSAVVVRCSSVSGARSPIPTPRPAPPWARRTRHHEPISVDLSRHPRRHQRRHRGRLLCAPSPPGRGRWRRSCRPAGRRGKPRHADPRAQAELTHPARVGRRGPLPTATDVKGDLTRNWGRTPLDLRPQLVEAEQASNIPGAARILAIIAYRESRFEPTAHNGDAPGEQSERNASWRAYTQNKARNPALAYGEVAAAFGSGGLFGALAPYFLWTGIQEMGAKAPLLAADPRIMFVPQVATFAACVFMARLLKHYDVRDLPDIKVGWGSVSLLKGDARGGETYQRIRNDFVADATTLGIDLNDAATIPPRLSADHWPGVAAVFERLVGKLPTPRAVS
jgi:hypothetical protein